MPTKLLKGKTSYELLYGSIPTYDHLRVFGCLCYVATNKQGRDKFQPRTSACVFVWYPFGQKGYKVMDLESNKIYVSRDVAFHERIFPFASLPKEKSMFQSCSLPSFEDFNEVRDEEIHSEVQLQPNTKAETNVQLRRSTRSHKIPNYLQDYVCCSLTEEKEAFCFSTLTKPLYTGRTLF